MTCERCDTTLPKGSTDLCEEHKQAAMKYAVARCPKCVDATYITQLFRSITDPANDVFLCECGHRFNRYSWMDTFPLLTK